MKASIFVPTLKLLAGQNFEFHIYISYLPTSLAITIQISWKMLILAQHIFIK